MRRIVILLCVFLLHVQVLYGQVVDDEDFRMPPSTKPGQVDISLSFRTKGIDHITLCHPKGIRRANMVLDIGRSSFEKDADSKNGGIDIYQIEFDREGRPFSAEQLTSRGYDLNSDLYLGFHSIDIRHEYSIDGSMEIHYLDSKGRFRYVWKYENDLIVKCELFSGLQANLKASWEWEYEKDSILTDFRKFDNRNRMQYHFKYAYDGEGQLNHVQKTFLDNEILISIHESDKNMKVVRHYESLSDCYDDCYAIRDGLLVKDYRCEPRRKSKAKVEIRGFNAAGLPIMVKTYTGLASQSNLWEYEYNEKGSILQESFENKTIGPNISQYTYNDDNQLILIKYFTMGDILKEWASFEYDENGNVSRWNLSDKVHFEMEYHYFEQR